MSANRDVPKEPKEEVPSKQPARAIVEFCRFARTHGLSVGTKETIDCLQAVGTASRVGADAFKFTLRAVLCSSKEEWDLFDEIFATFWLAAGPKRESRAKKPRNQRFPAKSFERESSLQMLGGDGSRPDLEQEDQAKAVVGASAIERLRKIDFAQVPQADLAELERVSSRLLRRLSWRVSRKLWPKKSRGIVDLRRTIRLNLGRGSQLIELSYKRRKQQPAKLVILLDVSDSMNPYSLFLLKFAYVLKRHAKQVECFIFSTELVEVNDVLGAQRLSDVFERLSQMTTGWSGGTRIGGSLNTFNRLYAGQLLSRNTAFIILSDGWDTEAPEILVTELRRIKHRVNKLIWLNPLLGLKDYEPVTRGISAALPYIDVFAAAHNLESLLELEKHLGPRMAA